MSVSAREVLLVYDKACPVCDNYCRAVRINNTVGRLLLVNARDDHPVLEEITARDLDIDQGMVLKLGEQLFYGADAIQALALLSSRSGAFNRINFWLFKSPRRARLLYPLLRTGRNLLLKILGRTKINNLALPNNEKF